METIKLPKEKLAAFNLIVRNLKSAVRNSELYSPEHPVFDISIKNLKASLDKWFLKEEKIDLGITQDDVLLDQKCVREKNTLYKEVAEYLHGKGVIAISIAKGVGTEKLSEFFKFIKNDVKIIRKKGGFSRNVKDTPYFTVREIDYSALLSSAREEVTDEDKDLWELLMRTAKESTETELPDSKIEFLADFLNKPEKAASALNKIYKDAQTRLAGEQSVKDLQDTLARVWRYFEKGPAERTDKERRDLANLISRLDPDLVIKLFEQSVVDGRNFDLAKEIIKGLSDDFIADFMESMISTSGTFSENLLKIFDKIVPTKDKLGNVISMVTDRLFEKKLLSVDTLSKLQISIRDIFKANSDSDFMSQMYKMTVETFVARKAEVLAARERLVPLVKAYEKSVRENKLRKEEANLLLNIIWLENDPADFRKFSARLMNLFPDILKSGDTENLRGIYELFTERLHPQQKRNSQIYKEVGEVVKKITRREAIEKIISFIPKLEGREADDIMRILSITKHKSGPLLIDAFIAESNQLDKHRFGTVLAKMKEAITDEIIPRLKSDDPSIVGYLLKVLREADPEKAHEASKELFRHKNIKVRLETLENFRPKTDEEQRDVFRILKREKSEELQNRAISVLVRTKNKEVIDKLFNYIEKNLSRRKHLLKLVEECGHLKVRESAPHLKRIFSKRPIFYTKQADELRVASIVSLRQLSAADTMEFVEKGLEDKSERVRSMCRVIMELKR